MHQHFNSIAISESFSSGSTAFGVFPVLLNSLFPHKKSSLKSFYLLVVKYYSSNGYNSQGLLDLNGCNKSLVKQKLLN